MCNDEGLEGRRPQWAEQWLAGCSCQESWTGCNFDGLTGGPMLAGRVAVCPYLSFCPGVCVFICLHVMRLAGNRRACKKQGPRM